MGEVKRIETSVGPVSVNFYGGSIFYVGNPYREHLSVNRVLYSLYGRLHLQADGSISRRHVNEHGNVQFDTFDLTRADWARHGSYGGAKGSAAAHEKAERAIAEAIQAELAADPTWALRARIGDEREKIAGCRADLRRAEEQAEAARAKLARAEADLAALEADLAGAASAA